MDQQILSRIDRAVADNLNDIRRSFGEQAGLVQDFIIFISRQLKTDLFGYSRFTLQHFCMYTGRNRQDLALIHPDFASGRKQAPVLHGYAFQTILDYALYSMLERNIIFSHQYQTKDKGSSIQMSSFPILKDLKFNFNRHQNQQKVYDVRLSDELISGFISRYYIIDADSYKMVGKGRGGDSRKKLLIYLSKIRHVLQSTASSTETIIPMDRLCRFADISDQKPSHRKQNLDRMLCHLRDACKFQLEFEFVGHNASAQYYVKLHFTNVPDKRKLQTEHTFYLRLITTLRAVFESVTDKSRLPADEDQFQFWLSNSSLDTQPKSQALQQAYYLAFNINVSGTLALEMILSRDFLRLGN